MADLGPDEFVTTFTDVREHEAQVEEQFQALKKERDTAFELVGKLVGAISEVVQQLSPPLFAAPAEVRAGMEKLRGALDDAAQVPPPAVR